MYRINQLKKHLFIALIAAIGFCSMQGSVNTLQGPIGVVQAEKGASVGDRATDGQQASYQHRIEEWAWQNPKTAIVGTIIIIATLAYLAYLKRINTVVYQDLFQAILEENKRFFPLISRKKIKIDLKAKPSDTTTTQMTIRVPIPIFNLIQKKQDELNEADFKQWLDTPNKYEMTPINIAAYFRDWNTCAYLINLGAKVDIPNNDGWTPVNTAAYWGRTEIVEALIKAGATVDIPNNDGWTPINNAAYWGHTETVKVLIKAGAKVDIPNNNGFTPLMSVEDKLKDTNINETQRGKYEEIKKMLVKEAAEAKANSGGS